MVYGSLYNNSMLPYAAVPSWCGASSPTSVIPVGTVPSILPMLVTSQGLGTLLMVLLVPLMDGLSSATLVLLTQYHISVDTLCHSA